MKIQRIHAGEIKVRLKVPFKTALRTVHEVHDLVLLIETDQGLKGFGEAPPTALITGDTLGSMRAGLAILAPQLLGRELADFNALLGTVQRGLVHNNSLKAALEIALFDLRARSFGVPLYRLLGGGTPQLKTDITISLNDTATMVRDSLAAVAAGFDTLKVKLGTRTWRQEVDTMLAIRSAVGTGIVLRLDANQGWTPKQAVQIIDALEQSGTVLDFVEQPVQARDLAGLKFVTERVKTSVLADEAVFDPADALGILSTQSADILNIKLMKSAGISQAIDIAALARRYQIPCMIGCMLESGISVAAAAHFAVAHADVVTRVDLDGPLLCADSPVDGGMIHDGPWIRLSEAPGLGIESVRGLQEIQTYPA